MCDWSSDVCSSDLPYPPAGCFAPASKRKTPHPACLIQSRDEAMNAPRFHPNCAAQKRHRSNGCNGPARRGFAPALSGGRRGGLPGPLAARRVSGGGPLCMGSTDIRAHVRLNTFAEWTSKTASAAFDIPYHSHLGGASQGAGKVFSQLFAFQRRQQPGACTSALTSGPVSTTIIYGRLDDLRQGFCPAF